MTDIPLLAERAAALLDAHHNRRPLVLPTVWDAWSARAMVSAGFSALTVGSHPLANSLGAEDGEAMSLEEALEGIDRITASVDVPVSADLESGYDTPAPELIAGLLAAGAVGVNIEDTVHSQQRLRTAEEHAEYISDLRRAADAQRVHVVINARTDVFKHADEFADPTAEVVRRLNLCAEAGADCVYPVAMPTTDDLRTVLSQVSLPLNVTAHPLAGAIPEGLDLNALRELGVSRVTFGPLLQAALQQDFAEFTTNWHDVSSH
ncbi:isocitrate lyase/phosphoenolpyruvate mutase family protein [Brevibacterium sp.]|uniref:isocitrate lyase/PEP mutase family protein n=1 Tax=Brevibacterium sp. TaxID=1701 RepID=UPI0028116808|nr:isocitrate lyase/phosphoenolpyruvate mutase family protein [Brevibacterium sp.]